MLANIFGCLPHLRASLAGGALHTVLAPGRPQSVTADLPLHHLPTLYFPHPKVLIILIVFSVDHMRMHFRGVCVFIKKKCSSFIRSMNIFYLDSMSRHFDVSRARDYF